MQGKDTTTNFQKVLLQKILSKIANMQKSLIQIACALQNLKIFDKQQVDFVKKSISNN